MTPAPRRWVSSPPLFAPNCQLKPLEPAEDPQTGLKHPKLPPPPSRMASTAHDPPEPRYDRFVMQSPTAALSAAAGDTGTRRRKPQPAAALSELRVELVRSTTASRPPSGRSMLQAAPEAGPLGVSGAGALIWLRALLEAARRLLHRRRDQPYDTDARRLCASQKPLPDALPAAADDFSS